MKGRPTTASKEIHRESKSDIKPLTAKAKKMQKKRDDRAKWQGIEKKEKED